MRLQLITAAAAAALLCSTTAFAQAGGQPDVPSNPHQNSAHRVSPSNFGEPGYTAGGPRGPGAGDNGMQNTSGGMRDRDDTMGGGMRAGMGPDHERIGVRTNGDSTRVRINDNGAHLRLTTTQRTRVRDVIVRAHGPRLTHVTFRVGVGARIPRTVRVAVLPPEIVAIAPEWSGYSYFEYGDQIVIVDPVTFAIVATLPL
jgi:hypothetical protein